MLAIAFALIALNGFFVAVEFALVKVRATRLRQLAESGHRTAAMAEDMTRHLNAYLSACQVGITLASIGLGWVGEPAFAHLIEDGIRFLGPWATPVAHGIALTLAYVLVSSLHIVIGEQAPKIVAISKPEMVTLWFTRPMRLFYRLFLPFVTVLNHATRAILAPLGFATDATETTHTEEEARMILAESLAGGRDPESRRALVEKAFEFARKRSRQIMVPRADIVYLDTDYALAKNLDIARRMGFTRYPLIRSVLDDVIGMVHIRDLTSGAERFRSSADLVSVAREPLFVPEASTADSLLRQFQARRVHQAIVVDEYGGTSGLVTLEDVLEALIGGEIQDEFDVEAAPLVDLGGVYSVDGGYPLEELVQKLGIERTEDEAVTVGGYVQNQLGRIGRIGDVVPLGEDHALRVLETRQRRVIRVLAGPERAVRLRETPAARRPEPPEWPERPTAAAS